MTTSNIPVKHRVPLVHKFDRVVLLVDMDCFYCQVEEKLDPALKNKPLAVVQYNAWRGGGIIAVNYAARARGITRHMRGDEAKEHCPDIHLVKVPNVREKADLTKYREAGKEVANVLQRFTPLLERASVDEAYLDITDAVNKRLQEMNYGTFILQPQELVNTYAVGYEKIGEFVKTITTSFITNGDDADLYKNFNENNVPSERCGNIRLLIGASIANEIRNAVKSDTTYDCSAGIAHNKILAKLACGINKPNKQTILPLAQIPGLFETMPIRRIKGLGAKFGEEVCQRLKILYLGQLVKFTEAELKRKFEEKNGSWLYNICRGIDLEAVIPRFYSKSIGCCKKFPGRNNIRGLNTLQHWLNELANEITERLEKDICENNRRAKQMVVSFIQEFNGKEVASSRSAPLQCYDAEILAKTSLEMIRLNTKQFFCSGSESVLNNPIKSLSISVGKFETILNSQNCIQAMFSQQTAKTQKFKNVTRTSTSMKDELDDNLHEEIYIEKNDSIAESLFLKAKNSVEKQSSESKESPKNKSFFLNALKKPYDGSVKGPSNENNYCWFGKTGFNSIDNFELKCSTQNELSSSIDDNTNNEIPQKTLFAKALEINEFAPNDLNSDRSTSNIKLNTEQNNFISEINCIQNEEIGSNSEIQNIHSNNLENNGPISKKRKWDETFVTKNPKQTHYNSQYVEFAVPELRAEFLQFTNCSKCGANIFKDPISMQTHEDYHYAQEISKQQRHNYREEIRLNITSTKSPSKNMTNKKSKKVQNIIRKTSSDITKFFKSSSTLCPETSNSNIEMCNICKLPIKIEEVLEHKDFHMAKDLEKELNQLEVRTVEVVKKPAPDSSREALNTSMNMMSHQNKSKSITLFFAQSSNI